jgi:hypothetical protein
MAVLTVLALTLAAVHGLQSPTYLQTERIANPVAISTLTPRLSWRVDLTNNFTRETSQISYQVQVLDLITGTVAWDTSKTVGSRHNTSGSAILAANLANLNR